MLAVPQPVKTHLIAGTSKYRGVRWVLSILWCPTEKKWQNWVEPVTNNVDCMHCAPDNYIQYCSKVTWQPLETRDTTFSSIMSCVSSRVSNELAARLFLRRANPTNDPPLLCAVATFLLKWLTASRIKSDYAYPCVTLCKNIDAKHGSVPCSSSELVLCLPWHNVASTEPAKS